MNDYDYNISKIIIVSQLFDNFQHLVKLVVIALAVALVVVVVDDDENVVQEQNSKSIY